MLENLTDKLGSALRSLRGVKHLTQANVEESLKEIRKALLSADVHFKVAREFISNVEAACIGQQVLKSVTPGQQVIKIINDQLVQLLGEGSTSIEEKRPLRIMLVGLHGSGKTTSAAKLANYLSKKNEYNDS